MWWWIDKFGRVEVERMSYSPLLCYSPKFQVVGSLWSFRFETECFKFKVTVPEIPTYHIQLVM
jgi:hypothetical protein